MTVTRVSVISSHQRRLCHQKKNQSLLSKMTERTGHFSKCNPVLHPCHYHSNVSGCSFEWVHRGAINMALCTTAQLTQHNHQTAVIGGSIPALLFTLKMCAHITARHLQLALHGDNICAMSSWFWGFNDTFKLEL